VSTDLTPAPADTELAGLLAVLWERNRDKLITRLTRVRDAIATRRCPPADPDLRADLHALIGALGTYGFPSGSDLLTRVQSAVTGGGSAEDELPGIDALLRELRAAQ
jgi:hypothetical protein